MYDPEFLGSGVTQLRKSPGGLQSFLIPCLLLGLAGVAASSQWTPLRKDLLESSMFGDSPFKFESIARAMEKMKRENSSIQDKSTTQPQPKNLKYPSLPLKTFLQVLEESYENPKPRFVQIHHRPSEISSWYLQIRNQDVGVTNKILKKESLFELRRQIFNRNYFIIENVVSCMCLCMDASGQIYTNSVEETQRNDECLFNIPSPWYTSDLYTMSSVKYSNSSHSFTLGWQASFLGSSLAWSSLEDQRDISNIYKFMFVPVAFKELLSIMEVDLILQTYKVNKRLFEYCPRLLLLKSSSSSGKPKKQKKKTCSLKDTYLSSDRNLKRKCRRKKRRSCIRNAKARGSSAAQAKSRCIRKYKLNECKVLKTHAARNWKESYVKVVKQSCSCVYKKWPRASVRVMMNLMKLNPCQMKRGSRRTKA